MSLKHNESLLNLDATLIHALFKVAAYEHEVGNVSLIETHISWVLLTGRYAYKIKKPVNFGFLDFSTLEKRRFFCHEEIRLNRRLAADWYLEVVPITEAAGQLRMNGKGDAIEYAVKMRQFPSAETLRERGENSCLNAAEIDQIASRVADFHNRIEKADEHAVYGDCLEIRHWFTENFRQIRPLLHDCQQLQQLEALETWGLGEWTHKSPIMAQRKQQGFVRECHGDLHLGNMTLVNGQVVLFDCIEFNPMLRWIDVISEVAFLVMDLVQIGCEGYAYRFLNRYLQETGDYHGLTLLPYYLVYRALVRAKVAWLRITQNPDADAGTQARYEYARYVNLAERFTQANRTVLVITHGFSGSGKSWFAAQLAEKIGAIQIRSDSERKRLFGYQAQDATGSGIGSGVYTAAAGQKTYRHLAGLAKVVLESGYSVIIDATFLKVEQRHLFRELADKCQVAFRIIDFQASEETLSQRIQHRQNDPSEATLAVLAQQQQAAQPFLPEEQHDIFTLNTERDDALATLLNGMKTGCRNGKTIVGK